MEQNAENEGTLATCARVSHTFSEPALEVLWRELFGLDRLLSILRKSVKHTEMTLEDFPNFPFKRFVSIFRRSSPLCLCMPSIRLRV